MQVGDSVLDGVMIPAAGRGGATEFPFYLCSIRRDDFALALNCVVRGISRGVYWEGKFMGPHIPSSALLLALQGAGFTDADSQKHIDEHNCAG
jgi:hypothetical protein